MQEVEVHEDPDAHRERGHRQRGPEEQGLGEVLPERGREAVPEREREEELHERDEDAPLAQGLPQPLPAELHPRQEDEDEDAELGHDREGRAGLRRRVRVDQPEDRGPEDDPREDLPDHRGLPHLLARLAREPRGDEQNEEGEDEVQGRPRPGSPSRAI